MLVLNHFFIKTKQKKKQKTLLLILFQIIFFEKGKAGPTAVC